MGGISKITNFVKPYATKAAKKVGEFANKSDKFSKAFKNFEPVGGDNSVAALSAIMVGAVLIPRIITATTRNPEDKEGTKDEITEIICRDIPTILTMLFGLKGLNSLICNISTKASGIPMVEKAFKPLFSEKTKGFTNKLNDVVQHPIEKGKILVSNILSALHPTAGSKAYSGSDIISKYTNYNSVEEIQRFIADTKNHGGSPEKVFEKIRKSIIEQQQNIIDTVNTKYTPDLATGKLPEEAMQNIQFAQNAIDFFSDEKLTLKAFMQEDFAKDKPGVAKILVDFFKNKDNALAKGANRLNAILRTLALGIEVVFLGFGLPAMNQKRLEKKYLSEKPIGTQNGDTFSPINDKHIKAQEIKLYSSFMK